MPLEEKRNLMAAIGSDLMERGGVVRGVACLLGAAVLMGGGAVYVAHAYENADGRTPEAVGIQVPSGYRDWKLISVAHEEGNNNDLRAVLGNDVAIKAYREGKLPFPDGAIIARLAWSYVPSEENNKAFGRAQSFVAGPPINLQFMVKDSARFAATGGWGFAQFKDAKSSDVASPGACFACHQPAKVQDLLFTHYAP